jgi:hypothetical protein
MGRDRDLRELDDDEIELMVTKSVLVLQKRGSYRAHYRISNHRISNYAEETDLKACSV